MTAIKSSGEVVAVLWMGKRLSELSRDELVTACDHLIRENARMHGDAIKYHALGRVAALKAGIR